MKSKDAFGSLHPLVGFVYYGIIFLFSCLSVHPVCTFVSFCCALLYYINLQGRKATELLIKGVLPVMLLTIIINPAFSHAGVTVLTYLPSGNPLTLESIIYGVEAAFLLAGILLWFACFSITVTGDKFVYLFGRIIPALSLLLSMTLRFVPRFIKKLGEVREIQAALGKSTKDGKIIYRIKNAISCFSIVITWSMENSIETSDSMKARGYGSGRRTAYTNYVFEEKDILALIFILIIGLNLLGGGVAGMLSWHYYPSPGGSLTDMMSIWLQLLYTILCLMPMIINRREELVWKRLKSKI